MRPTPRLMGSPTGCRSSTTRRPSPSPPTETVPRSPGTSRPVPTRWPGSCRACTSRPSRRSRPNSKAELADVADWSFQVTATSTAPVGTLWPLVGEAARWKEWSFLTQSGLEREGDPAPDGVGAIRRFTTLGMGSREEVVLWEPPHHLGYVI